MLRKTKIGITASPFPKVYSNKVEQDRWTDRENVPAGTIAVGTLRKRFLLMLK